MEIFELLGGKGQGKEGGLSGRAVGIHWGTYVTSPILPPFLTAGFVPDALLYSLSLSLSPETPAGEVRPCPRWLDGGCGPSSARAGSRRTVAEGHLSCGTLVSGSTSRLDPSEDSHFL